MERRLAAIFTADMVGYSRLIEADEVGTHNRQKLCRSELLEPRIDAHHGRIVKLTGDGLIAEFPSVVEAVQCAVTIQREMTLREADVPEDRRIQFRIAVNLGDVILEDGDIYGDGVNIAARLEALAQPGGVVVSGTAYDQLKSKIDVGYEDLGLQQVKNIETPIRVYRIVPYGDGKSGPVQLKKSPRPIVIVAALAFLIITAGAFWWAQHPNFPPADPTKMEYALDKPSIAVLAFENLTGDPEREHVSDGISEDIITTLARLPGIVVIARNSSFVYKGDPVDARHIAEELSVRYLLEGSLQSFGDNVRVNTQLIDAVSGHLVWTSKFDRPRAEFFEVRDQIIQDIVAELDRELLLNDAFWVHMNEFASIDTWLLNRKVMWHVNQFSRADNEVAIDLLLDILEREPRSAAAHAQLAFRYAWIGRLGWDSDPDAVFERAAEHAQKAIDLNSSAPYGYSAFGFVRHSEGRNKESITLSEQALKRAPGDAGEMALLAIYLQRDGQASRSVELFERAVRMHRNAPGWFWSSFADSLRISGRCEDAIPTYQTALENGAAGFIGAEARLGLAVCHDALGQPDEARAEIAAAIEGFPKVSVSLLRSAFTFTDEAFKEDWLSTLKSLGLPEK